MKKLFVLLLLSFGLGLTWFYWTHRFIPITTDADGYKVIRVHIAADYGVANSDWMVKQLLANVVNHMPEKVKIEYVTHNPHLVFMIIHPKIKRFVYNLSYWGAHKIFINIAETAEFGFYPSRKSFHDFALKNKTTVLALGYLYSMPDERYCYLPYYAACTMPELWQQYPNEAWFTKCLQTVEQRRALHSQHLKDKFCILAFIKDDRLGLRSRCMQACQKIDFVHSCGQLHHNSDLLWNDNGKRLQDPYGAKARNFPSFQFNICIENSSISGYVSEKLFDAMVNGTVPIYCGCDNRPNPKVFNQQAILFWDPSGDNNTLLEKIRQLHLDPITYQEMLHQPMFLPTAAQYLTEVFKNVHVKLENVLRELGI